jgi:hypothetical protein
MVVVAVVVMMIRIVVATVVVFLDSVVIHKYGQSTPNSSTK